MLRLKELVETVGSGEIGTVVPCFPDMQGRLIVKRREPEYFLDGAYKETRARDYLVAPDIDRQPAPGCAVSNQGE